MRLKLASCHLVDGQSLDGFQQNAPLHLFRSHLGCGNNPVVSGHTDTYSECCIEIGFIFYISCITDFCANTTVLSLIEAARISFLREVVRVNVWRAVTAQAAVFFWIFPLVLKK